MLADAAELASIRARQAPAGMGLWPAARRA